MKIICIGRNYADHVKEFDSPKPAEPIYFMKPDTALLRNNNPFYLPSFSSEIHYETELVVRINRVGRSVEQRFAHRYYSEVALGIDFTARDIQRRAIAEGLPWEQAKGFDNSAAISEFVPLSEVGAIDNLHFQMWLNGEQRQVGFSGDMLFSVDEVIAYVSQFVMLRIGDLIYTGTPSGVGAVAIGDRIRAELEGRELLNFEIK